MKQHEKKRIIEILELHGSLDGNNSAECSNLIKEVSHLKITAPKIKGYEYFCNQHSDKVWVDVLRYCDILNIPFDLLASTSREGKLTVSRNVIWYVIIQELGASDDINNLLGGLFNRKRTTIRSSYGKTKDSVFMKDKMLLSMINTVTN